MSQTLTPARRAGMIVAGLALAASSASAQSIFDSELRLAPQFQQYRIASPADETISQLSIPLFVTVPLGSRFSMDVGTAYARSRVTWPTGTSEVSGLTDTQVRGNLSLGTDFVILTVGLNLPTGHSAVTPDEFTASSRIGSDFLSFPISNMGTGFAATGGIAVARPAGAWSVGFGAAMRRSQSYEPFNVPGVSFAFRPGNEYRVRLGGDRPAGNGRVALGVTWSAFDNDDAGGLRYNVGDRIIGQGVYSVVRNGTDWTLAAYDVVRQSGRFATGTRSGRENTANLFGAAGFHPGGGLLEPSVELRHWAQQVATVDPVTFAEGWRSQSSMLARLGLRTRVSLLGITAFPSAGYTLGNLATTDVLGVPMQARLTGFHAGITMRTAPFAQ